MLRYYEERMSDRKKRLYLVGCCRSIWDHMKNEPSRRAVLVAERFADGLATSDELSQAFDAAHAVLDSIWNWTYEHVGHPELGQRRRAWSAAAGAVGATSGTWATDSGQNLALAVGDEGTSRCTIEMVCQTMILRCLVGNPFRTVTLDRSWLTSNVVDLAQTIYDERAFDRLPILADALMDAGCDNEEVLAHCRSEGPHVRGCWPVDLILGKS